MFRYPCDPAPWRGAQPPGPRRSWSISSGWLGPVGSAVAFPLPSAGAAALTAAAFGQVGAPQERGACFDSFSGGRLVEAAATRPSALLAAHCPDAEWPRSTADLLASEAPSLRLYWVAVCEAPLAPRSAVIERLEQLAARSRAAGGSAPPPRLHAEILARMNSSVQAKQRGNARRSVAGEVGHPAGGLLKSARGGEAGGTAMSNQWRGCRPARGSGSSRLRSSNQQHLLPQMQAEQPTAFHEKKRTPFFAVRCARQETSGAGPRAPGGRGPGEIGPPWGSRPGLQRGATSWHRPRIAWHRHRRQLDLWQPALKADGPGCQFSGDHGPVVASSWAGPTPRPCHSQRGCRRR